MKQNEIESMLEDGVPNIPTRTDEKKAVEYVGLVYTGTDKVEAYKQVFPDRYERISTKALQDRRNVRATVMYHIASYERGKYVSSLYDVGSKSFFVQFVNMKFNMLNEMYNIGMDKEEDMKHRLNAGKIFLSSIPDAPKEVTHKVEVDVANNFKNKLAERQKMLYSMANEDEILDIEIDSEE